MKTREELAQIYVDACSRLGQAELDLLHIKSEAIKAREALTKAMQEESNED